MQRELTQRTECSNCALKGPKGCKMNNLHRQRIFNSMDKLIHYTNYTTLRNECIQRDMLSLDMVLRIESLAADETTRHKLMFEKITRRGPKAFNTLLDICQRNFPKAYAELNPSSNDQQMHSTLNPQRIRNAVKWSDDDTPESSSIPDEKP
ncbi:uncharacterized protein LOC131290535 isoform X3 [Anopheles ziemanni]|uniref:uncharacterized protein LOC131269672 isoform X4 n=1 Tax=Anopheles coustani TaxID=139045 RepID=UPI002659DA11|nr:uncharacterized protein LOC131269672 isoform X4 [Anopheles coustani]XP_058175673.1 uncharacterized protein LOC131290535 isoform X3 [Anopheles ziemanni]